MHSAQPQHRRAPWVLWLCVLTLLAKASMPFLATASAERQGRALVEVCTVYGVATVAVDGTHHDAPHPGVDHAAEHCALTALLAFAGGEARTWHVPLAADVATVPTPSLAGEAAGADAAARWAAQLRHGPPHRA